MDAACCALEVEIPCDCGRLEGRLLYRPDCSRAGGLVLCPPHPLLAGNLENNVIQAIAAAIAPRLPVLLFNYRAVGRSSRPRPDLPLYEYWNELDSRRGYGEIVGDVRQVLAWARRCFDAVHLAGYSFGAWIALQAAPPDILSYSGVAPPLAEHDFSALAALSCPVALILEARDGLLAESAALAEAGKSWRVETIEDADHFFLGQEQRLAALLRDLLPAGPTVFPDDGGRAGR